MNASMYTGKTALINSLKKCFMYKKLWKLFFFSSSNHGLSTIHIRTVYSMCWLPCANGSCFVSFQLHYCSGGISVAYSMRPRSKRRIIHYFHAGSTCFMWKYADSVTSRKYSCCLSIWNKNEKLLGSLPPFPQAKLTKLFQCTSLHTSFYTVL